MTYRVRLSAEAFGDIVRNSDWWTKHRSSEQAARWEAIALAKVESLAEGPESFPLAVESDDWPFELREAIFGLGSRGTHRVLFRVSVLFRVNGDVVDVIAIRSARQDRFLPPSED